MSFKKPLPDDPCQRRVNELLREVGEILVARSSGAEDVSHDEFVAEVRAQAVVMSALADRCAENIKDADMANIDRMADSVLDHIKKNEVSPENLN